MDLDRPEANERRLAENIHQEQQPNIHCPEEILYSDSSQGTDEFLRGCFEWRSERDMQENTQPGIRERTARPMLLDTTNTDENRDKGIVRILDKHIESATKAGSSEAIIGIIAKAQSNSNPTSVDTKRKRQRTTESVCSSTDSDDTRCNNTSRKRNDRMDDRPRKHTKPLVISSDDNNSTNDTPNEHEKHNTSSTITTTPKRGRGKETESSSDDEPSKEEEDSDYYTFIIHKCNQQPDWKRKHNARGPNFITFDHGDHLHIIFRSGGGGGNVGRAKKRITTYLGATVKGTAEAIATFSKVNLLINFILYLLRYGLKSMHYYGNKVMPIVKQINDLFQAQADEHETVDLDAICRPYIEARKEAKEKKARCGKQKQKNITDIILDQIETLKIQSVCEWERRVDSDFKTQLLREFGVSADSYITRLIKINKMKSTEQIRNKPYIELIADMCGRFTAENYTIDNEREEDLLHFMRCVDYIEYIFDENKLDMIEFFAWLQIIRNKQIKKINTLVIQGPTNAGKSLITRCILEPLKPELIPRENDNSQFKMDQLPNSTAVLFEEPVITPNNVGTWKLIMEGTPTVTDMKNRDKEWIPRTPIFVTTENTITAHIDERETAQINQRIKLFVFKKGIKHNTDSYARTGEIIGREIKAPPGNIEIDHFAYQIVHNWFKIKARIQEIIADKVIDTETYIREEADTTDRIKCIQVLLQKMRAHQELLVIETNKTQNKVLEKRCQSPHTKSGTKEDELSPSY